MVNNLSFKKKSIKSKKNRNRRRKIESQRQSTLFSIISLGLILLTAIFITRNNYISRNSKNLEFAVEYTFTNGFSSENKLLRVQTMSLIYCDGDNAIVEAFGLSKAYPHQSTSITGSFKKDTNRIWYLEEISNN